MNFHKKYKSLIAFVAIAFILISLFIIIVAVVYCHLELCFSGDGILSVAGAFIGTLISGAVSIFILFSNKKDTDRIQKENMKQSQLQFYIKVADDTIVLVSEMMRLGKDYSLNSADNTNDIYKEVLERIEEIITTLQIKLSMIENSEEFLASAKNYMKKIQCISKAYEDQRNKKDKVEIYNQEFMLVTENFCKRLVELP